MAMAEYSGQRHFGKVERGAATFLSLTGQMLRSSLFLRNGGEGRRAPRDEFSAIFTN